MVDVSWQGDRQQAQQGPSVEEDASGPNRASGPVPAETGARGMSLKQLGWLVAIAMFLGIVLSTIVPPMKSPDEPDHLRRAYLFGHGYWLLDTEACEMQTGPCRDGRSMTGGMMDTGLAGYMALVHPADFLKRSETSLNREFRAQFRWQGNEIFVTTPGTGYYLPLVYAPQALAFRLGQWLDLGIDDTYYLTRYVTMLATVLMLALAGWIYRPPLPVAALLLIPMTLFQFASSSIDAFSTALAVLALACFFRTVSAREKTPVWILVLAAVCVVVVGGARAHLAAMVLMLFTAAWFHRSRTGWIVAVLATVSIMAWYAVAIPATADFRMAREYTTGDVAMFYLNAPGELLRVLWQTLTSQDMLTSYLLTFFGYFFNTHLNRDESMALALILLIVLCLALPSWRDFRTQGLARLTLMVTAIAAVFLAMLAMLLTWTPHPATMVIGVQGRYLLVPVMLMVAALCCWRSKNGWRRQAQQVFVFMMCAAGVSASLVRMMEAYYMPWQAVDAHRIMPAHQDGRMLPGPVVAPGSSVSVELANPADSAAQIEAIGVLMATYLRDIPGDISLSLKTKEGASRNILQSATLRDNRYHYFRVTPGRYERADIGVASGEGGFSVWMFEPAGKTAELDPVHADVKVSDSQDSVQTAPSAASCLVLFYTDGSHHLTPGCPPPAR